MSLASPSRIASLDLVRGVAVMGIFSVNVIAFAMIEAAYFNPSAAGGWHGWDRIVWVANMLLVDGKMRSLFSMLFGASMLLVIDRAEAASEDPWRVHGRRMAVLAAVGLAHYALLWFGDILFLYALTGLVAFRFRDLPVPSLLRWSLAFLAFSMLLMTGMAAFLWAQQWAAHAPGASADALRQWNESAALFYPTPAQLAEDRALMLGPWTGIVAVRLGDAGTFLTQTLIFLPETLGLMLLGMASFRSGLLTGEWDDATYRRLATAGIAIGLVAHAVLVVADLATQFALPVLFGGFVVAVLPFRLAQALGYAALIILLSRRLGPVAQRFAAVGRAAFSNYLGTSLVATALFYGWGLGLYGSLSRWQAWLLVPLVWAGMLAWSKPWLDRYRYGPLEWAWRSLARGRAQPMRR